MTADVATEAAAFWSRVDRGGGDDSCWNWTGPTNSQGKCRVSFGPRNETVQRVAYRLSVGPIPSGMLIIRSCGNTLCCNPAHLELVTPAEAARRRNASTTDKRVADGRD